MGKVLRCVVMVAAVAVFLLPSTAAAQARGTKVKKTAPSSAAGAISQPRTPMSKLSIYGSYSFGFQCAVGEISNSYQLGWIPADVAITIDFDSTDTSDPIATLSSIQFENFSAGGERFNSDDEGGNLNPYFRMMKPYAANWVLTVGAADGDIACYSFKVTLQ